MDIPSYLGEPQEKLNTHMEALIRQSTPRERSPYNPIDSPLFGSFPTASSALPNNENLIELPETSQAPGYSNPDHPAWFPSPSNFHVGAEFRQAHQEDSSNSPLHSFINISVFTPPPETSHPVDQINITSRIWLPFPIVHHLVSRAENLVAIIMLE